ELRRHDFDRFSGLTLMLRFTDAEDRGQTRSPRGGDLVANLGVGFPMPLAPLRMPEDHVTAPEIGQHLGADVAGVGTLWRTVAVLPAERDPASGQKPAHLGADRRRRTDDNLPAEAVARRSGGLL